ncbi:polysaccharide pyruvyl transferase family protein [Pediococcus inopinatus]|uniref:Polysaccharide pyruvyl transferase family protein n=1 Tax=Pediococcus inopinatus TaxID=114090 RepID=A0ABZ0Q5X0_9LACO|nr:polysaccharide pyruvyl transferase family protein [Pediococcus inopinatus]WPC22385.1 polysaccharide pyruvyl transferase family protein [Pediococcus inopinatus]
MKKMLGHYKRMFIKYLEYFVQRQTVENSDYFLMDEPDYGNLGDQAIAYAEYMFIEKYVKSRLKGIEIQNTISQLAAVVDKQYNYPLLLQGGGNFGDRYLDFEEIRRFIISRSKKQKIVMFPQTIDFEDKAELERSIKIYSRAPNLTLVARESRSFNQMARLFQNRVIMVPDIVLSLQLPKSMLNEPRFGVITLFRNDGERSMSNHQRQQMLIKLQKRFNRVSVSDTHLGKKNDSGINHTNREKYLFNMWKNIASHQVVVTDRLHGMIFAYITKTPCVVIKNSNHKITDTYSTWLSQCNYIEMMDDFNDLDTIIDRLLGQEPVSLNIEHEFLPLIKVLKG